MSDSDNTQEPVEVPNDEILTPAQDPVELAEDDNVDEETGMSELEALKIRAKALGINFSPNLKDPAVLKARINEHIEKLEEKNVPAENKENAVERTAQLARPREVKVNRDQLPSMSAMLAMTADDLMRQPAKRRTMIIRARQQHEQLALVRCQVYNNNPAKNDLHGEIFSVQNKYLGVVRKYIPYGEFTENGYHIPRILVNMLRSKKYLQVRSVKNPDGTERTEQRQAPEFTINELPPLTKEELQQLANMQGARASATGGLVGMTG